jgi:hypothetical protein
MLKIDWFFLVLNATFSNILMLKKYSIKRTWQMWGKHYPTVKQRIKGVRVKAIVRDWYMQGMPDEKSNTSLKYHIVKGSFLS